MKLVLLTDEEKIRACELAVKAGTDFVKTSTGFSTGGATVEDVALMRKTVGPDIGVKASGGVRNTAGCPSSDRSWCNSYWSKCWNRDCEGLMSDIC